MPNVPYIATAEAVTVHINGRPKSLRLDTAQGQKLLAALRKKEHDFDEICSLADMPSYIAKYTRGRITVDEKDQLHLDGKIVDYGVSGVITRMINDGADVEHLMLFLEHVDQNPDKEIADHLYRFLEVGGLPITPDGHFHAFKRVQDDYFSYHSGNEPVMVITFDENDVVKESKKYVGKVPHTVGSMLVMDRTLCDPDRNRTCSVGLHACSFDYLQHYMGNSGKVVVVKIKPSDVTAIPSDYNDTKLRCCAMEIVDEISAESAAEHFKKVVEDRYTQVEVVQSDEPEDAADDPSLKEVGDFIDDLLQMIISDECDNPDCEICHPISDIPEEDDEEDDGTCGNDDCIFCHGNDDSYDPDGGDIGDPYGDEEEVSFVTVVRWAREDGEADATDGTVNQAFHCKPEDGISWTDVPEHLERTYIMHYTTAYVEQFELDDYASERAYAEGEADGKFAGKAAFSSGGEGEFPLNPESGVSRNEVPYEHQNAYDFGYAVGYLESWNLL